MTDLQWEVSEWAKKQTVESILTFAHSYCSLADELFGHGTDFQDQAYSICVAISSGYWNSIE